MIIGSDLWLIDVYIMVMFCLSLGKIFSFYSIEFIFILKNRFLWRVNLRKMSNYCVEIFFFFFCIITVFSVTFSSSPSFSLYDCEPSQQVLKILLQRRKKSDSILKLLNAYKELIRILVRLTKRIILDNCRFSIIACNNLI